MVQAQASKCDVRYEKPLPVYAVWQCGRPAGRRYTTNPLHERCIATYDLVWDLPRREAHRVGVRRESR